jgi:hypothetical protein
MTTVYVVTTHATMTTTTFHAILNQKWFPWALEINKFWTILRSGKFRTSQVDYLSRKVLLMSKCLSLKTLLLREKFSRYVSVYASPNAKLFLRLQYRLHVLYSLWLTSPVSRKESKIESGIFDGIRCSQTRPQSIESKLRVLRYADWMALLNKVTHLSLKPGIARAGSHMRQKCKPQANASRIHN